MTLLRKIVRRIPYFPADDESGHADLLSELPPGNPPHGGSSSERGAWAERLAAGYLCDKGMEILAKNYRCKFGEIDLILSQGITIVFVEVRFRRSLHFGTGAESVDCRKKRRIVRTARHYLQQNPLLRDKPCRFDIVSISLPDKGDTRRGIQWISAAFDEHTAFNYTV
uniref:UPF0102 protein BECKH772A_GA0070896_1001318 n=1 Tax=Candidatus Kentrum eta TaxID=2126337 RepID=A0A450UAI6_9GAMM|nr:MAG: putative endonuclease [Candidatus Kentron sp. H]VFJ91221.1 MAG: putative endonuclease [Candidatus Kentron sp. H]VFJ97722.1 MAG: putative endonuclease [Candidatus Kentron sp. H]